MNPPGETKTLRDYLRVLREGRLLVLAAIAIAVGVALVYAAVKEPEYEATATIEFTDERENLPLVGTLAFPSPQPEKQAAVNARLVTRDDVLERARAASGTSLTLDQLQDQVRTEVLPDSNLIAIIASADNAELASSLANATAEAVRAVARKSSRAEFRDDAAKVQARLQTINSPAASRALEESLPRLLTLGSVADPVSISRPAEVPGSPTSPKPLRDSLIAAVLGLIAGIAVAFFRASLDRRISDAHEAQREVGLPLVGYVRADVLGMVGASGNGRSRISEEDLDPFRILRTNVDFLADDRRLSSVVVTSALPEEGKTTVASWYAYANALAGRSTLLIECDFRRPTISARFGLEESPGLTDYLAGDATPKQVVQAVSVEGLEAAGTLPVIVAGENAFHPAEMIASKRFQDFFDQVTRAYDLVVVDTAPLLPVGDTLELLPQADGVIFCVRVGQTTLEQAASAKQAMDHLADKPTGLVITGLQPGSEDDYYGYYSYGVAERPGVRAT